MSQKVEIRGQGGGMDHGSGFEALRSLPDFGASAESLDDHDHSSDHFALIYENRDEQFGAVVPFIRQGIQRNERCMYIVDENTREDVITALRDGGVAVDAALDTGQLSFHTVEETYLAGGEFDVDEAQTLLEGAMEEALAEFDGFRVTAEESWLAGDDRTQTEFMTCEAHVNGLIEDQNCLALCQYNRAELPPAVIEDVINTHPYLIYDGTVCRNFYYKPPEEYFGPSHPARDNERKLESLVDRTTAREALRTRDQYHRDLYETIADPQTSFDDKIRNLLELGRERFGLEIGYFTRADDDDTFEIVDAVGSHDRIEAGVTNSYSDTYCEKLLASPGKICVTDAAEVGWTDDPAYETYGLDAYFARTVHAGGEEYGTLCFASETPRQDSFTEAERTFLDLMGRCVGYELERRRRERFLRESYQITSNPTLSFEEKLEQLFDVGREWFGLEMAGLNHLPSWDGEFQLEKSAGMDIDPGDEPLWTDPGDRCFCRKTIESTEPVAMPDVRDTDWQADQIHREFGLTSYLGTKVTSGPTPYGTLWFGSTEPRDREFSEAEHTFIDLIGQWVSFEIERREYNESQRELYEITANADLSFDETIDRLLDLGRERFGLDMGFVLEKEGDQFRVVKTRGTDLEESIATISACPGQYCKQTITVEHPVGVEDVTTVGWDDDPLYREYDLGCYLGTRVTDGTGVYGSVCFATSSARDQEFTEAEYAFLELLGQCVSYELERRQHEADLEATIDQLQQSNDRLKQFAYAASHDLQEPLRMVSSYLRLLENRYKDDLDQDAQEFIEFAVGGADRMRAMVDGLLSYSRVEQADGEFEPVDLDAVVDTTVDDLQFQIEENDAEIVAESMPTVTADSEQLEQLFSNLVSNAVKYNDADSPRVRITAERRADHWEVSVADNGIGIHPERSDQIFEVFNRLHNDDEYSGTGIGLSLCQEIVDNHGGEIWVDSEPGEGSTFTFTLPTSPDA